MNTTLYVHRPSSGLDSKAPILASASKPDTIPPYSVLLRIDRFGFSANNVTYQSLGEHSHFRYFDFHEVPSTGQISPKTHGLVPVWGFATVEKSEHPGVQVGERVYGYFAPTRYLVLPVSQTDLNKYAFYVPRPHLPTDRRPYNQVIRCANDAQYSPDPLDEDLTMLYRPLFWTSYWLEDHLFASNYRDDATRFLISSASSKTAFCLAYCIRKRIAKGEVSPDTRVIGLTSRKNTTFTRGLGLYDEIVDYDSFRQSSILWGDMNQRWIYIDVSGSDDVNREVFAHFASPYTGRLATCVALGMTTLSPTSKHASDGDRWSMNSFSQKPTDTSPFWPKLEPFFMPEWLEVRRKQIPVKALVAAQVDAWKALLHDCRPWVNVERVTGSEDIVSSYKAIVNGNVGPEKGLIWSLWDGQQRVAEKSRL